MGPVLLRRTWYAALTCGRAGGRAGDGALAVCSAGAARGAWLVGRRRQAAAAWRDRRPDRQLFGLHTRYLTDCRAVGVFGERTASGGGRRDRVPWAVATAARAERARRAPSQSPAGHGLDHQPW